MECPCVAKSLHTSFRLTNCFCFCVLFFWWGGQKASPKNQQEFWFIGEALLN